MSSTDRTAHPQPDESLPRRGATAPRRSIASALLAFGLLSSACSSLDDSAAADTPNPPDDRGPIGKADNAGSCRTPAGDHCGGKSQGNCYCDSACVGYGDCCSDYQGVCTSGATHLQTAASPYLWVESSYSDFLSHATKPPFPVGDPVAPGTPAHRTVAQLQVWADRIHAAVVKNNPAAENVIPPPVVVIRPARSPNAWVSGIPTCVKAPVAIDVGEARPERSQPRVVLLPDGVKDRLLGQFIHAGPMRCVDATWSTEVVGFVESFNQLGGKCQLSLEGGVVHVSGDSCEYKGQNTGADEGIFYATSPYVHFSSEMIAISKSEASVVGTLAHELGHYYNAHALTASISDRFDFWYEQGEAPTSAPASPASDSNQIQAELRRVFSYPIPTVPGQAYSPRLTRFVLQSLVDTLLKSACTSGCPCDAALATVEPTWKDEFACFGCGNVSANAEAKYLEYEEKLSACAGGITIADTASAATLSRSAIQTELIKLNLEGTAPPDVATVTTLEQLLNELQAAVAPLDDDKQALLKTIEERHLGRYTTEQEADDFSLEYGTQAALTPQQVIAGRKEQAEYLWQEDSHTFVYKNGIDFPSFLALSDAGWVKNGAYQFVPLGNLHERHHGMCYRAFNLSREQTAHSYSAVGQPLPPLPWSEVVAEAKALRDQVPNPPPGGGFFMPDPNGGAPIILE